MKTPPIDLWPLHAHIYPCTQTHRKTYVRYTKMNLEHLRQWPTYLSLFFLPLVPSMCLFCLFILHMHVWAHCVFLCIYSHVCGHMRRYRYICVNFSVEFQLDSPLFSLLCIESETLTWTLSSLIQHLYLTNLSEPLNHTQSIMYLFKLELKHL